MSGEQLRLVAKACRDASGPENGVEVQAGSGLIERPPEPRTWPGLSGRDQSQVAVGEHELFAPEEMAEGGDGDGLDLGDLGEREVVGGDGADGPERQQVAQDLAHGDLALAGVGAVEDLVQQEERRAPALARHAVGVIHDELEAA